MENRAHAFIAGLFTLLLGAAILTTAMWLSGDTYERVHYVLESPHSVTGLNIQATVRLRGVDVGKVDSIGFDPENPRLILIGIGVKTGTPITRGTVAQLGTIGLTGLTYVKLEDEGKLPELLPPSTEKSARIKVYPSVVEQLTGSGKDLVEEFRALAARLNHLLDEKNQDQLMGTLSRLEAAADRVIAMANAFEPAAASMPPVAADARKVLARTDELLVSLKDLTQQLAKRVDTLDRVAKSAEQVGGATQSASGALRQDALPRINALVEELAQNSRDLDRLINQLNDQPASLVFGRTAPAPGPGEPGFDPQRGSKR
jgi:phospholipid/cholesterol/gamma-HCH transport system substrate-binding protein